MQPITDQNLKGPMMKKIILPTLFFLFSFLLISCGEISISESNELSDSDHVIKWFDCLNGDEMVESGELVFRDDTIQIITE